MPQEQFWRVKHKQKPSPESSEEDRDSTVTACTGNNAIQNEEHDAGKDLRRERYSESVCYQDCQRSSQRSRRQWRCKRKPNTAEVKKTRRATFRRNEDQQGWDSVEQHSSVQDPGAQAQSKQKCTRDQQACLRQYQS